MEVLPELRKIVKPYLGKTVPISGSLQVFCACIVLRFKIKDVTHILLVNENGWLQLPGGKYEETDDNLKNTAFRECCEELLDKYELPVLKEFIHKNLEDRNIDDFFAPKVFYAPYVSWKGNRAFNVYIVIDVPEEYNEKGPWNPSDENNNVVVTLVPYKDGNVHIPIDHFVHDRDAHWLKHLARLT